MTKEKQEQSSHTTIDIKLNQVLDNQQYNKKETGEIKNHLVELNHRTEKLELQNTKEAIRAETNKEWQEKENKRIESESKLSRFWITTVLALMTLIATGVAVSVTAATQLL